MFERILLILRIKNRPISLVLAILSTYLGKDGASFLDGYFFAAINGLPWSEVFSIIKSVLKAFLVAYS